MGVWYQLHCHGQALTKDLLCAQHGAKSRTSPCAPFTQQALRSCFSWARHWGHHGECVLTRETMYPVTHQGWGTAAAGKSQRLSQSHRAESVRQDPLTPMPSLCWTSGQRNKFKARSIPLGNQWRAREKATLAEAKLDAHDGWKVERGAAKKTEQLGPCGFCLWQAASGPHLSP